MTFKCHDEEFVSDSLNPALETTKIAMDENTNKAPRVVEQKNG